MKKQSHYEKEFKNKIVRLHLEEGRTLISLSEEYGVSSQTGLISSVKNARQMMKPKRTMIT